MRLRGRLASLFARVTLGVGASVCVALALEPPQATPSAKLEVVNGTLSITNSKEGTAILSAQGMMPGDTATGTVTITNSGTVPGDFSLSSYGTIDQPGYGGGLLSTVLLATVTDVSRATAPVVVYSGPIGAMPSRALGTFAPGERRGYRFEVRMPDAAVDFESVQGGAASISYRWDATEAAGDTSPPPDRTAPPDHETPSGGDPPPDVTPPPPPPDAPLTLTLTGKRTWSARKKKGPVVTAMCGGTCTLRSKVKVNGAGKVKLKVKSKPVASAAGRGMKLSIVIPKKAASKLRKAAKKRKKASIVVTVTATDARGLVVTKKHKIKVKK